MKKVWKYLSLTLPACAAMGIGIIVTIVSMIFYFLITLYQALSGYNKGNMNISEALGLLDKNIGITFIVISYVLPIIWAIIFFFWYRNLIKTEVVSQIKLYAFKNICVLALMGFGISLLTGGLMSLILPHFDKLLNEYTELMEEVFSGNQIGLFISIIILAPISEELIFRGVILKKACRVTSFVIANIIQAALFGIFHINIVQGIYTFAAGLALGYVAYKFKTIKASILLHMFFNASNYIPINLDTVMVQIIGSVIGAIIIIFTVKNVKDAGNLNQVSDNQVHTIV